MNKYKICVVTGSRADYGLLRPLIKKIAGDDDLELRLLVTGMHLSENFGYTCAEIEADGYAIDARIEMLLSSDTETGMAKSTGLGIISFADYLSYRRPHMLIALGDRFEMFSAVTAAAMLHIPIAHIYGGDTTEGAIDEFLRHSMTKMSSLHFASNEMSARRIIQMGESPDHVYNVGSLHVECIMGAELLSHGELAYELGIDLEAPYALVTYHPATLSGIAAHASRAAGGSGGGSSGSGSGGDSSGSGSGGGGSGGGSREILWH